MPVDCIFCRIAAGEIPAKIVREDEATIAFRDVNPQAPTHILVIPRRHIASIEEIGEKDAPLIGALFIAARDVASRERIADAGYRLVINVGPDAGQTVPHIHLHVLGGRVMRWPPG
jgi:histidine triad (HIT) family protein